MIKTICDMCGKEITNVNPYEFHLKRKIDIRGGLGNNTLNGHIYIIYRDVCDDCANSIYYYIKGLRKEC